MVTVPGLWYHGQMLRYAWFLLSLANFQPLPPLDPAGIKPAQFTDAELDLPYYLVHFERVANSVGAEGDNRGFINLPVWRATKDNRPYNARIMENHLAFAFFYTTKRPWNPYYASPAVRERLEAVLEFWRRMQAPDGRFSEYSAGGWNLPATAFATKFMGETLRLLKSGPPIDPALHKRVIEADRKAIRVVLTDPALIEHGKHYSNQYTNVWAGALAYLSLYPDPEIRGLLARRMKENLADLQSPAGYYYERDGPDWGYNMFTHQTNNDISWKYARGTDLDRLIVEHERRFLEWLSYNAVREPDGWFVLNRAIETRQRKPWFAMHDTTLAQEIPLARAFASSKEDRQAELARQRAELERDWARFAPLRPGEFSAYTPYAFFQLDEMAWHPTAAQRREAAAALPYLARERFTRRIEDTRRPVAYTFIRRPGYYAAFNSGKQLSAQQRYGLGLVWTPRLGAILQSQTASSDEAWGTRGEGRPQVYEAGDLNATFSGDLTVEYPLGLNGRKRLAFTSEGIRVSVQHPGAFTEQIPLLGESAGLVESSAAREVRSAHEAIAGKPLVVLTLRALGTLAYELRLP